ncbi:MAG: flagellar filament capping protein FliD [Planctomycetota bacterium]
MSSLGINFSGLASGLDTNAIVEALVAVERRPIQGMEDRKTQLNKARGLLGDFKGLLDKLRTAAGKVRLNSSFLDYKVALDDDTRVGATIGSGARAGSWDIEVSSLANAKVATSNGHATLGQYNGQFLISDGTQTRIVTLDGSTTDLEGVAAKINEAGLEVQAQVLDTGGTGSDRYKLVVSSTKTGDTNRFTLTADWGTVSDLVAEVNDNANIVTPGSNAQFKVNGVAVTRPTNSFSDVITGLNVDLKGVHPTGEKTRITVTTDASTTAEKIKGFVDAYNAVVDFVADQNELDKDGKATNPLFGDSTLRSARSSLRSIMGGSVATGNDAYALLSQVGITSDRDGKLTLDQAKLEEAINTDEDAVAALFSDATNGIAARVYDQIDVYTGAAEGLIKARNEGFDRLVKDLDRRIDSAETRLEAYEKQLVQRFAAMETLVGRLQSQGGALGSLRSPNQN